MKQMYRRTSLYLLILSLATLTVLAGCTTYVRVRTVVPAPFNFGLAKELVLIQATGRQRFRERVLEELASQSSSSGWWNYQDKRDQGIQLQLGREKAFLRPEGRSPRHDQVYIRLDFHKLKAKTRTKMVLVKDGDIEKKVPERRVIGKVVFSVTSIDGKGRMLFKEREFLGAAVITGPDSKHREAKLAAIAQGIKHFLKEITPSFRFENVRIDDSKEDLKFVVKYIKEGDFPTALKRLRVWRKRAPSRADVHYNLAVVIEAMGNYTDALKSYDNAIKHGGKPYYSFYRDRCARRLEARKELEN